MTRLMVKDLGLAMALAEHAHSAVLPWGPWPATSSTCTGARARRTRIFQYPRALSGTRQRRVKGRYLPIYPIVFDSTVTSHLTRSIYGYHTESHRHHGAGGGWAAPSP